MKIVYIHDSIAKVGGVERIFANKMNYLADVFKYNVSMYILLLQSRDTFIFFSDI